MGCVSPSTVFHTREGYVVVQHFAPRREWENHQLLSLPSEEGEGADSPLSAPWCETGVYRDWEKCTNRSSNTLNLQPGERKRSGRICSYLSFITPVTTQEKLLGQNYISTNHSVPLLFILCRALCTARRTVPDPSLPWSLIIPGELRELPWEVSAPWGAPSTFSWLAVHGTWTFSLLSLPRAPCSCAASLTHCPYWARKSLSLCYI